MPKRNLAAGVADDVLKAGLVYLLGQKKVEAEEAASPHPSVTKLKLVHTGLCMLAGILLLVGLWRLTELALGPILAPLIGAAVLALGAVSVHLYLMYIKKHAPKPKPGVLTNTALISLLEVWLAPKSMRKTIMAGMALNWVNRNILHKR